MLPKIEPLFETLACRIEQPGMKTLSMCMAACLCLLSTTIASNTHKGDFFCGHKKIPFAAVQSSAKRACKSLRNVENFHTLPAAYSGTTTLNIDDAILFSWPIEKNGGTHSEGSF